MTSYGTYSTKTGDVVLKKISLLRLIECQLVTRLPYNVSGLIQAEEENLSQTTVEAKDESSRRLDGLEKISAMTWKQKP